LGRILFWHYFVSFGLVSGGAGDLSSTFFGRGGFVSFCSVAGAGFGAGTSGFLEIGIFGFAEAGGTGVLGDLSPLKFSTSFIISVLSITDFNFAPNVFESCSNQVAISFFCLLT